MRNSVLRLIAALALVAFVLTLARPTSAQVTPSAMQLNFGSVFLGDVASKGVTLTNSGVVPVYFLFSFPGTLGGGDFSFQTDCPQGGSAVGELAVGSSCTIQANFSPTQVGSQTQTLFINVYDATCTAATCGGTVLQQLPIGLSGTGVSFTGLTAMPTSLNFGYVLDGQTSNPRAITLTNTSTIAVNLSNLNFSGSFSSPTGFSKCGSETPLLLSPNQSCSVSVVFGPQASGAQTGSLTIGIYSTSSGRQIGQATVSLTGTGHPISVQASLNFGSEEIGLSSTAPVAVLNAGPDPVSISAVTISGSNTFSQTSNCIGALPSGTRCVINVSYKPTAKGSNSGTLSITDGDALSPQMVALSGAGSGNKITVSPAGARGLVNFTFQFAAYQNGELSDGPVEWSSSDPAVATIDPNGKAKLIMLGTTAITATFGGQVGSTVLAVTTPAKPVFSVQPADTGVSQAINSGAGVQVQLFDLLGDPLPGQSVTIAIGNNGAQNTLPGSTGVLTGTLTQITDSAGVATFQDLAIDWLGQGYTLLASANLGSIAVQNASIAFNELRVGDPCLAPENPACSSGCSDSDGDGLNDAWEMAGGIDINGDGLVTDSQHDVLLAGADPNKPDIYVWYDWMDYGVGDWPCSTNNQCPTNIYHWGETCSGPPLLGSPGSCVFSCNTDADCTTGSTNACNSNTDCAAGSFCFSGHCERGGWHTAERCINNVCEHTHDPLALDANPLQPVVDRFAAHGINLHLIRGQAQPHSHVVSYRDDASMTDHCEGGSLASGTVGIGKYAVSLTDLKRTSLPKQFWPAYHYALFGHYVACDTSGHCTPEVGGGDSDCPAAPPPLAANATYLVQGMSGLSELSGNDFVVSLGGLVNDQGYLPHLLQTAAFMHELGHNLGLRHDGHVDTQCRSDSECQNGDSCADIGDGEGRVCHESFVSPICTQALGCEQPGYKPNFISIMNYRYEQTGIFVANAVGSDSLVTCKADSDCASFGAICSSPPSGFCARVDYSEQTLPTGGNTPGALVENNLDEPAGLGSGTADLFTYKNGLCASPWKLAASDGPVDWSGSGLLTLTGITADVDANVGVGVCDGAPQDVLSGHTEWPDKGGAFAYTFQCNLTYGDLNGGVSGGSTPMPALIGEQNGEMMIKNHTAYPLRPVSIVVTPDCGSSAEKGTRRSTTVTILGAKDLDVSEIDPKSLDFHGAKPRSVTTADVNHDGFPDLVLEFENGDVHLPKNARHFRLYGSLKCSQDFIGDAALIPGCAISQ